MREACFSHSSAVRRNAVGQVLGLKGSFARLARTRRSFRSSRGRSPAGGIQDVRRVIRKSIRSRDVRHCDVRHCGTQHTESPEQAGTKNSNDFVRHASSPSRRDQARQVVIPKSSQNRPARSETAIQPLRHSLRPPQLSLACSAFPAAGSTVSHLSFFLGDEARMLRLEKFRHRTPLPILLWVRTQRSLAKP